MLKAIARRGSRRHLAAVALSGLAALTWTQSAHAGVDRGMCSHTDERITMPENFPLDVCFDGKVLHVANTDLQVVAVLKPRGDARIVGNRETPGAYVSEGWFVSMIPGLAATNEIFPGTRMKIEVGSEAASLMLGTPDGSVARVSLFPAVKSFLTLVPLPKKPDTVAIGAAFFAELMEAIHKSDRCERNATNFIGRAKCDLLRYRDISFATARAGVKLGITWMSDAKAAKKVLGWAAVAFETTKNATDSTFDYRDVSRSGVITFSAVRKPAPAPERRAPSGSTPAAKPPPVETAPPVNAPPAPEVGPLGFSISGSCTTAGGTLTSSSAGFTPGGRFEITVAYPDGRPYTALARGAGGTVRADGSISWTWPCAGDPAGTYTTEIRDAATGRTTGAVPFTVGEAPAAPEVHTPPASPPAVETPITPVAPVPATVPQQQATNGADTFLNPYNASGKGVKIAPMQHVEVSCKLHAESIGTARPGGYWYRIASPPWNNQYYAVANTFWNLDVPGQGPYDSHFDPAVPDC